MPRRGEHAGAVESPRRAPGQLEAEVLAALWTADGPRSPAEVQAELGGDLAYTTVVTILSRLQDKGVLNRHRIGRAFCYEPVTDRSGLAARRMRAVLDSEDNHQSVLARFVSTLSSKDEKLLRRLLDEQGE